MKLKEEKTKNYINIKLGKKIGQGFENNCFLIEQELLEESKEVKKEVLKTLNWLGKLWQHNSTSHFKRCIKELNNIGIKTEENIKIIKNVKLKNSKGIEKEIKYAQISEFKENYESLQLTYNQIVTIGKPMLQKIITLVYNAETLRKKRLLGLDPLGADIVKDVFKGIPQYIKHLINKILPQKLKLNIKGIEGKTRNILLIEDSLIYSDIGLNDLSSNAKMPKLMKHYNSFTFTGIIEIIKDINKELETNGKEFIEWEIIDKLKYPSNNFHKFVSKKLLKMMLILFKKHDENNENKNLK